MAKLDTPEEAPKHRYAYFRIHYPHATFDSWWLLRSGGTFREVEVEHPMARIEAVGEPLPANPANQPLVRAEGGL